jgi:hypothetical protein
MQAIIHIEFPIFSLVKHVLLGITLLLASLYAPAQMSGVYTIGGTAPDFMTIQSAIDSLESIGMNGPVTLNIRDGVYNESLRIDSIPGNSISNPLIIQSESQDSSQVHISFYCTAGPTAGVVSVYNVDCLEFRNLSIEQTNYSAAANGFKVFYIIGDVSFTFQHCSLRGPSAWPCATIEYHPDNIVPNKLYMTNSSFEGGYVSLIAGYDVTDSIWIDSSYFNCEVGVCLGYSVVTNSVSDSIFSVGDYNVYAETHFYSNEINVGSIYAHIADVHDNHFYTAYFGNWGATYDVHHNIIDSLTTVYHCANLHDNKCLGDVWFSTQTDSVTLTRDSIAGRVYGSCGDRTIVRDCFIGGDVWLDCDTLCTFDGNHFSDFVRIITPGYKMTFTRNVCDTAVEAMYGWNAFYSSNIFGGLLDIWYSDSAFVVHNNFLPGASLKYSLVCQWPPLVKYNNFSETHSHVILNGPLNNPRHNLNNYFPETQWVDANAWHYDPQYNSASRSTNLMLNGRCPQFSGSMYDIDSVLRPIMSTVGASEICATNSVQPLTLNCADSVQLSLCSANIPGYSYSWSPVTGLSNSTAGITWANPDSTTMYYCTVTDSNAALIEVDSFLVDVSYLPIAFATYDWTYLNPIPFTNLSNCADTYLWDFGDGDTSTLSNPVHTYAASGVYLVTLIACNTFGCDTFVLSVTVYVISTDDPDLFGENIQVFPNPVSGQANISTSGDVNITGVVLLDVSGRLVRELTITDEGSSITIELYEPPGSYLLLVKCGDYSVTKQLFISH